MQYQSECIQQDVTIEFLPHGSDMPYRIVTINNPIKYIDPTGHCFSAAGNAANAAIAAGHARPGQSYN